MNTIEIIFYAFVYGLPVILLPINFYLYRKMFDVTILDLICLVFFSIIPFMSLVVFHTLNGFDWIGVSKIGKVFKNMFKFLDIVIIERKSDAN